MQNTKLVRITLSAVAPVQYTEVIEVAADMSVAEMQALAERRYHEVDPEEYGLCDDGVSWSKGTVDCVDAEIGAEAKLQLVADELQPLAVDTHCLDSVSLLTHSAPCTGHAGAGLGSETPDLPIIVIEVEGGMIQCIRTSKPAEIITIDADIDGSDSVRDFMGDCAIVKYQMSSNPVSGGAEGMDPEFCKNAKEAALALSDESN